MKQNEKTIRFYDLPNPHEDQDKRKKQLSRFREIITDRDFWFEERQGVNATDPKPKRAALLDASREGDEIWCRGIINLATSWKDFEEVYKDVRDIGATIVFKKNLGDNKIWKDFVNLNRLHKEFRQRQTGTGRKKRPYRRGAGRPKGIPGKNRQKALDVYIKAKELPPETTIRDFARELGMSVKTIYDYSQKIAAEYGDLFHPIAKHVLLKDRMSEEDFKLYFKPRPSYPHEHEKAYIETRRYLNKIK